MASDICEKQLCRPVLRRRLVVRLEYHGRVPVPLLPYRRINGRGPPDEQEQAYPLRGRATTVSQRLVELPPPTKDSTQHERALSTRSTRDPFRRLVAEIGLCNMQPSRPLDHCASVHEPIFSGSDVSSELSRCTELSMDLAVSASSTAVGVRP